MNTQQVDIRAIKKAENSDFVIIRLQELWGRDANEIIVSSGANIVFAYEVDGQERKIGAAVIKEGKLCLNLSQYSPRSYAVQLDTTPIPLDKPLNVPVALDSNKDGMRHDANKADESMDEAGHSIPAEMLPETIMSEGIIFFPRGPSGAGKLNVLSCQGQTIQLPSGKFNRLYLLAGATEDTNGMFRIGGKEQELSVQCWTGFAGQFDNRLWDREFGKINYDCEGNVVGLQTGYIKRDNIAWFCTHRHKPDGADDAYQFSYLFKYTCDLSGNVTSVVLPHNPAIKIFAMTAAWNENDCIELLHPLYDDFTNRKPVKLRVF